MITIMMMTQSIELTTNWEVKGVGQGDFTDVLTTVDKETDAGQHSIAHILAFRGPSVSKFLLDILSHNVTGLCKTANINPAIYIYRYITNIQYNTVWGDM
jgi:hypothetical protein